MNYTKVDLHTWKRKEHYQAFTTFAACTFSLTTEIEITELLPWIKQKKYKFYPTILHLAAKVVNQLPEFRMDLKESDLIIWDQRHPSYTIFHESSETFSSLWSEYDEDLESFLANYERDFQQYKDDHRYFPKEEFPPNIFYISAIPWISFTNFNLQFPSLNTLYTPTITMGKYFERDQEIYLPIAIQLHHAVADGFHAAQFFNQLQKNILSLIE